MKKSGFIEGTLISTLAIVITKILGMLYVIPFYAIVGVQGGALYAYAYNIYVIFLDISSASVPSAMSKIVKEYQTLGKEDAKVRAYKIGRSIIFFLSTVFFIVLMVFAGNIATLILGDLSGGNSIEDVAFVIRCVSLAILIVPFLSVTKGYLQGHNIFGASSASQVIEQVVRILIMIVGSYIGVKIFNIALRYSIGIAVSGAFFGGLAAILYIYIKIKKSKDISFTSHAKDEDITNKDISLKLLKYAIPYIIINIAASLYNFIDMVFISRTMEYLKYNAETVEFVTSAVTTWSGKIGMIITSIAMGLTLSLIPNIVEAFTLKKWDVVEDKLNKSMQIILTISTPMVIGLVFLSKPIWNVFYGGEQLDLGASILAFYTALCLLYNFYLVTTSTLQSLNKFKLVIGTTVLGYVINASLDIPLMLLCHNLNYDPYIGACVASALGYSVSILITLIKLHKDYGIKYGKAMNCFLKTIIPNVLMIIVIYLIGSIIKYNVYDRIQCILYITVISLIGGLVYFIALHKTKVLEDLFGNDYMNRILVKLHLKK